MASTAFAQYFSASLFARSSLPSPSPPPSASSDLPLRSSLCLSSSSAPSPSPRPSLPRASVHDSEAPTTAYSAVCKESGDASADEECEVLSGEWPENFSLLNFEDLCQHYEPILLKEEARPHTFLANVMSTIKHTATPDQLLEEVDHCFLTISGLPVINEQLQCIGVLSKKDRAKASKGLQSTVAEVMSSPPITLSADKTVNDAAVLMLKKKIHRIPIVNEANQVIGMVTRTDIFKALEQGDS